MCEWLMVGTVASVLIFLQWKHDTAYNFKRQEWDLPLSGAALFNKPTSVSTVDANTVDGSLIDGPFFSFTYKTNMFWTTYTQKSLFKELLST